jgi:mannose-6-phosphate isomerase-like protein (cupin superfamily)
MLYYAVPQKGVSDRENIDFSAIDIQLPATHANVAEISLTGRYPETGFALNRESEMIVRVLEGSTTFSCEGEEVELSAGATVLVQTHKKYCWIPNSSVRLLVFSTPAWTSEQHDTIPT